VGLVNQPWGYVEPPVTRGGSIPILLYEMAKRLAATDCDVTYFTRGSFSRHFKHDPAGIRFEYIPVAVDKALIRVQSKVRLFHQSTPRPFWSSDWFHPQFGRGLGMVSHELNCDIVHIVNYTQFIPAVRRHNPSAKIVMHMHCEWANQLDHALIEPRLREADLILGCSSYITRRIQEAFPQFADRCKPLWNGVFTDRFTPGDRGAKRGDNGSQQRIIFVGRVAPEKGVHILIEAFAKVVAAHPNLHLDIIGPDEIIPLDQQVTICDDPEVRRLAPFYAPGAYRAHLNKLVESHGLANRVSFLGAVAHSDGLVDLYRRADVAVIPSIWDEPFGIPVVEAMATGAVPIVTRVGAFPEMVEDGESGLIINRNDPDALAVAIRGLIENDRIRRDLSRAARRRATEHFGWDAQVDQLRGYYDELMAGEAVAAA
jgi:glycosyltransferase involved in cell wall biosynthesis